MKVLIISHVPMTARNNMGKTLLSLFSEFETDELCQMYIYPAVPDQNRCSSYYRVTDKEALKNILFGKPGGEIEAACIKEVSTIFEEPKDERIYRNRKNKSALRRLLRDAMWKLTRWNNSQLKAWLEREKPDCIFIAPGVAKFLYDFALTISRMRKIPIVTYICDEYYFVKDATTPLDKVRLGLLKGKIEKLLGASRHLVVISEELRTAYEGRFGLPASVLMTGTGCAPAEDLQISQDRKAICYFGNIRCNRFISLCDVGKALDEINRERGTDYALKIYTAEKDPEILGQLSRFDSVQLCGFVTGAAYDEAFHRSQLLLHVEAFDEASVDFVQHSVSTKIADSLASGIPLLAYGPEEISSMQHLLRHDCALTATTGEELKSMLIRAFNEDAEVRRVAENALAVAEECHNSNRNSLRLKQIIAEITRRNN